jgi:polysaccharide chain length determinant protein (PEP-CTERM system associated)
MKDLSNMDMKKYWQIIKGRKYLFILVSMIVMSAIVWGSFFMPKIYKADSTVFIERNIIKSLVKGMVVSPSLANRLKVLTYTMNSRDMLMKVIRSLDLDVQASGPGEIDSMIADFRRNTNISIKGRDLFMVSYKGKDPKMVRDYINALISIYVEENTSSKREQTSTASQFLTEQIAHYKKRLEESEDKIAKFRIENDLYYAADEKTIVEDIKSMTEELARTKMVIKEYDAKMKKIQAQLSGEEPLTLAIVDNEQNENRDLAMRLQNLERSLPVLLTRFTENYPEVIRIKAEIETVKEQIKVQKQADMMGDIFEADEFGSGTSVMNPVFQKLKEDGLKVESDVDSLKAKEATLIKRISKLESDLKNMPEDQKILAGLMRERATHRKIYEQLLGRMGQAEVSQQMELEDKGTTFRIVDPAVLPTKPVSPDRIKFILIGIVAGIVSAVGVLLLLEYFDHSFKDVDSLRSTYNLPVFAVIPQIITEQDIEKNKRMDRAVYAVSILYLSVIGGLFIKEIADKFL